MLDYNIIENKPTITIVTGDNKTTCYDLLAKTYNPLNLGGNALYIDKYYIARPDLISLAVYGTDKYADILCKVNGISNPFELNEGMIMLCPSPEDMVRYTRNNVESSVLVNNNATIYGDTNSNGNPKSVIKKLTNTVVNATIEAIKTKMKLKSDRRHPSEPTIGDTNFVIDKSKGIIIY